MSRTLSATFVAMMVIIAGCAPGRDKFGAPGAGYVGNPTRYVEGVDWSGAETVTVNLTNYEFTPAKLSFREGKPYRLRLENPGNSTHTFVSEGFFKSIAVESLETPTGKSENPYLKSIVVEGGQTKELLFVPVTKGVYELECTLPLHALFGMKGTIEIV